MNKITNKSFGGVAIKLTNISGQAAFMTGGRGACIIGDRITIGGAGYGIASSLRISDQGSDTSSYLKIGYGGIEPGLIIHSGKNHYLGSSLLLAAGALFLQNKPSSGKEKLFREGLSLFPVLEPSLYGVMRLTRHTALNLGVSYRYTITGDFDLPGKGELNGFSLYFGLLFGKNVMN